jgi:redox-sensing transcriptional repressor
MGEVDQDKIPQGVIERLPAYLSALMQLRQAGHSTVSSAGIGDLTEVNPAQIRRDLAHFGSFGKRGVGYDVVGLIDTIQRILGSDHSHRLVLVGAGNLGSAIAAYDGLRARGFNISAIFDNDPSKIGSRIGDIIVQDAAALGPTVRGQGITIGVLAVTPEAAQEAADRLCEAGVKVILNYTPTMVQTPPGITIHNTDPVRELLHTLYYLSRAEAVARV